MLKKHMKKNKPEIILILGGVRSGKSDVAMKLAARKAGPEQRVVYIATGSAGDDEMKKRIENHKKNRSPFWKTLEAKTYAGKRLSEIKDQTDVVLLDCLTMLTANILITEHGDAVEESCYNKIIKELDALINECSKRNASCIIVSNEVGMGIVPANKMGRDYRDILGKANKYIAARAGKVLLMIAGLVVDVKKISMDMGGD